MKISMNTHYLKNYLKNSRKGYLLYYYVANFLLTVLQYFVRKDHQLILFVSFGGKKYDDSPLAIYKWMLSDSRFDSYKFVWAFENPDSIIIPKGDKVKIDSIEYFITMLKATVWITNSSVTRGLRFKSRKTFYLNTWHGSPIKHMGSDINSHKEDMTMYKKKSVYDIFLSQSKFEGDIFMKKFNIPEESMKIIGYPRNDELVCADETRREEICSKLEIDNSKKIILYAPTFREYWRDEEKNCLFKAPIDLQKWSDVLGKDYILLFRAHYEVVKAMNIPNNGIVKDVSAYPNLNELMIISDILISDYSSIIFDYSILCRPILCFAYDYNEYEEKRGMYFDIRNELCSVELDNEDALLKEILNMDFDMRGKVAKKFKQKYVEQCGNATQQAVDIIYDALKNLYKA